MSRTGPASSETTRRSDQASSTEPSPSPDPKANGNEGVEPLSNDRVSVDSLALPADADAEEAAAIVAAVTEHLRAEAAAIRAAAAETGEEDRGESLWTFSVRMDRAPTSPVPTDVPADPWVAADRLR